MDVCITGDAILTQPLPEGYEDFAAVRDVIGQADVRINNLEMTITHNDCWASTYCGGVWLTAGEDALDDVCSFGFNGFNFANNHTMDYGHNGLLSTLSALRTRGLPVTGAGASLAEATAPAIIRTEAGSVALLGITSSGNDAARAGDPLRELPARPGVNMLRHSETFLVNQSHMDALQEIAAACKVNGFKDQLRRSGFLPVKPGFFSLGDIGFQLSDTEAKTSAPNIQDMERMQCAIKEAKASADRTIVYFHSHEIKGLTNDEPDFFIEAFARACIDWGADAVMGSGTHEIKGVEVYKGKPIFYSIGNFIFVSRPPVLPADFYEKHRVPLEKTAGEAMDQRSQGGTRGFTTQEQNYKSLMPLLRFDDSGLVRVLIQPLELGFSGPSQLKGLPRLAGEAEAQDIYKTLCRLSEGYGTRLSLRDGKIEVHLA